MSDRIRTIRRRRKATKKQMIQNQTSRKSRPRKPTLPNQSRGYPPEKKEPPSQKFDAKALQEEVDSLGPDVMGQLMGDAMPKDPDPGAKSRAPSWE